MKPSDLFRFSLDNLRRRKGRTVLTVIGVVVGVCAIVVMVSLGIAVNQATDLMLQNWGDLTKITVESYGAQQGTPDLDDNMVEAFKTIPHVVAATPMYQDYSFYGSLVAGRGNRYEADWTNIIGMDVDAIEPMGYELIAGNYLTEQSLGRGKIPVMIEAQAVFSFADTNVSYNNPNRYIYPEYDYEDPYASTPMNLPQYSEDGVLLNPEDSFFDLMNTTLIYRMNIGYDENTDEPIYKEYELVPVGILNAGDSWELMNGVVMSIENVEMLETEYARETGSSGGGGGGGLMYSTSFYGGMGGGDNTIQVGGYNNVYVKVDDVANMPDVEKAIRDIGYQIYSMSSTREQLQGQVAQTQLMLGGLAAVSLFVAALNIMNTMTMAIYERTKEIGVMKVLGCNLANIRQMFLIESGAIGLLGGIVGVIVSLILSFLLNNLPMILAMLGIESSVDIAALFGLGGLQDMMAGSMQLSIIPLWLILLALGFATVVGFLSGIGPANRAVKISSLEAIRHE